MKGIQTKPEPHCPICDAKMVLRRPKPGQTWPPFWGCPMWSSGCTGKREIQTDGTPEKPEDWWKDE
jgi:hypothetical protein